MKKDLARIERQIEKAEIREIELLAALEAASFDADELLRLTAELESHRAKKSLLEEEWLHANEALEGE